MTYRTYVAIDPGVHGAIAWSNRRGVGWAIMPDSRIGILRILREQVLQADGAMVCYIEKVAPYIPGGGASMMFEFGRQAERVECVAEILSQVPGHRFEIVHISPKDWQEALNLGKSERTPVPRPPAPPRPPKELDGPSKKEWLKREKKNHKVTVKNFNEQFKEQIKACESENAKLKRQWKNELRLIATHRFPEVTVTIANCDALLILDAAIVLEGSKLPL